MGAKPVVAARQVLRSSGLALGTSYDATPAAEIKAQGFNVLTLLCDLTLNTATSVEVVVEVATPADTATGVKDSDPVAGDWYAKTSANLSGLTVGTGAITIPVGAATFQLGATGRYEIVLPNLCAKWVRVKAKTTGGPGTTTLQIIGVQGVV